MVTNLMLLQCACVMWCIRLLLPHKGLPELLLQVMSTPKAEEGFLDTQTPSAFSVLPVRAGCCWEALPDSALSRCIPDGYRSCVNRTEVWVQAHHNRNISRLSSSDYFRVYLGLMTKGLCTSVARLCRLPGVTLAKLRKARVVAINLPRFLHS